MASNHDELLESDTSEHKVLRVKYAVPWVYGEGFDYEGKVIFSHCDSDITIYPDGSATESWMGLNPDCTSHEFKTIPWTKRGEK